MDNLEQQLREHAAQLLESQTVALVIGHQQGSDPHRVAPLFAETAEQARKLVLSPIAGPNLVRYLREQEHRVGIVVNGCEAKAVQVLLREHQLERDRLYLIGIPCAGVIDIEKLLAAGNFDLREYRSARFDGDEVVVETASGEVRLPKNEVLRSECRACDQPTPAIHDTLLGEPIEAPADRLDEELARWDQMSLPERRAALNRAFERCIRCYACVHVCPSCYCTTCIFEQTKPQWLPRTVSLSENRAFHLARAMHLAGRCSLCGACDRACPMGIPLRELYAKVAENIRELFGEEALKPDAEAPFLTFQEEDTEQAIDGAVTR